MAASGNNVESGLNTYNQFIWYSIICIVLIAKCIVYYCKNGKLIFCFKATERVKNHGCKQSRSKCIFFINVELFDFKKYVPSPF